MSKAPEKVAAYWDARASRYDRQLGGGRGPYADLLAFCRQGLRPQDVIADVGCGNGVVACALAPHVQQVHACDLSQAMLDIAAGHAQALGLSNIHFSRQDAAALTWEDGRFDAVLSLAVLHLMPKPARALAQLRRVLKPGGTLLAGAYLAGQSGVSRLGNALMSLGSYRDYPKWSREGFVRFLRAEGMEVLDERLYPMFPIPLAVARARVARGAGQG